MSEAPAPDARAMRRGDWIREVVAVHECHPKGWPVWSRFDREHLALALHCAAGNVAGIVCRFWCGEGREAPAASRLFAALRVHIGDAAIHLALVTHAWGGTLPAPGRGDAAPLAARPDRVALKFVRATAALSWGLTDHFGATSSTAGTVVVPGLVSVATAMLEALAEAYDLDVDDCVMGVLPELRARFGTSLRVAS